MFKTFLFIGYITLIFLLAGIRFVLINFAGWDGDVLVFDVLERLVLASLIYFLPATMNFILGRQWTSKRITRVIISSVIYLSSGIVSFFVKSSPFPGMLTVLAFFLIILFVLIDAARELPLIHDEGTRIALTLLYAATFLYLPLIQVVHFILTGYELILFTASAFYHCILATCASAYFYRALISSSAALDNAGIFEETCTKAGLTRREMEIARLISMGFSYKETASQLSISPNTVSSHVGTIYKKTGTKSKVGMVNALRI